MKRISATLLMLCLAVAVSGCGSWWLPRAHKIDIQQGNLLDKEALDTISKGMSMAEVESHLGSPLVSQIFRQDRWDYVYSTNRSGGRPAGTRLTLYFDDGRIVKIEKQDFGRT